MNTGSNLAGLWLGTRRNPIADVTRARGAVAIHTSRICGEFGSLAAAVHDTTAYRPTERSDPR
jgi:hypothetical protein